MLSKKEAEHINKSIKELHEWEARNDYVQSKVKSLKKIFLRTSIGLFVFIFLFLLGSYVYLQSELDKKVVKIVHLEKNINSLMIEEQLREEELIRTKFRLYNLLPNINLTDKVEQNLSLLNSFGKDGIFRNITRGNIGEKKIALTFDLSSGKYLEALSGYISKYGIHTTIFLSNENNSRDHGSLFSAKNQTIIRKLSSQNDYVEFGNHTWSHYNIARSVYERSFQKRKLLDYISDDILDVNSLINEMKLVEEKYTKITNKKLLKIYRLPYGAFDETILRVLSKVGYDMHISWSSNSVGSLDIPDYISKKFIHIVEKGKKSLIKNPNYKTTREVLDFLEEWENKDPHQLNGAIILLHLGSPRETDELFYILPEFIEKMKSKKYEFVKISEMLEEL